MAVSALSDLELGKIDSFLGANKLSDLAIIFTDIQGFMGLTELRGDAYASKLRRFHDKLVDGVIHELHGVVIKHCGDSAMGVFRDPRDAVVSALTVQKALREFNARKPEGVLDDIIVRIALHFGRVCAEMECGRNPDVFGRHVNRTARIETLTSGGQIYTSREFYEKVKDPPPLFEESPIAWSFHGTHPVKGLPEGIDIYEVSESALKGSHRPPRPHPKS